MTFSCSRRAIPFAFILALTVLSQVCLPSTQGHCKEGSGIPPGVRVPILCYHRFGPAVADSMTVKTSVFESQLQYLKDNGYTVIPLRQLVEYHLGRRQTLPPWSVVITIDDGHRSVYTDLLPLLMKYRFSAALSLYPSAISHASYAMTWEQLRELKATGLVDFQSHTFWHPDFRKDKKRLTPAEYETFVRTQLKKSKEILEKQFDTKVDMLAWPFGIYDDELIKKAVEAGYVAAFTIERRPVTRSDNAMALPRYIITDGDRGKAFGKIIEG